MNTLRNLGSEGLESGSINLYFKQAPQLILHCSMPYFEKLPSLQSFLTR